MGQRHRFLKGFPAVFLLILFFSSCSTEMPSADYVKATVIVEYNDDNSLPSGRFSVFAGVSSDIRYGRSVSVIHEESGLEWNCTEPFVFTSNDSRKWIGSSRFLMPEGFSVPDGKYIMIYEDKGENEVKLSFDLSASDEFMNYKTAQYPGVLKNYKKRIILYSNTGDLIFYGEKKNSWKKNQDIFAEYSNACSSRDCYLVDGGSVLILLPSVNLENKNYL